MVSHGISFPTAADGSDRPDRIKAMVGKNDLIVANGFLWGDATGASAAARPGTSSAAAAAVANIRLDNMVFLP